jgi:hypothetical protein
MKDATAKQWVDWKKTLPLRIGYISTSHRNELNLPDAEGFLVWHLLLQPTISIAKNRRPLTSSIFLQASLLSRVDMRIRRTVLNVANTRGV